MDGMTRGARSAAAVELAHVFDALIARVAVEHETLVRRACEVAPDEPKIRNVVALTLLGHIVEKLHRAHGAAEVSKVVQALCASFDAEPAAGRPA